VQVFYFSTQNDFPRMNGAWGVIPVPADAPVLVVEDDAKTLALITQYLQREGFRTVAAASGEAALEQVQREAPCLVILDLMLPGLSGLEVCRRLRGSSDVPILILSARCEVEDRVTGLRLGADDYLTKPFSPRELVARVQAILRRARALPGQPRKLSLHGVEVDLDGHRVRVDGREVHLTAFEFKLLVALMTCPGRVFTREELLAQVYDRENLYVVDRTVDVHIGKLRQKIEVNPARPMRILTIRGVGYKFREAGQEEWVG